MGEESESISERLQGMGDKEFERVVADDAKDDIDADVARALRSGALVGRWRDTLGQLIATTNAQFTRVNADHSADTAAVLNSGIDQAAIRAELATIDAEHESWRRAATFFKTALERRMKEAKRAVAATDQRAYTERVILERNRLREAVARHRDAFPDDELPSDDDRELWDVLDEIAATRN